MNISAWVFPSDKTDFVLWSLRHGKLVTATNMSVCLSVCHLQHTQKGCISGLSVVLTTPFQDCQVAWGMWVRGGVLVIRGSGCREPVVFLPTDLLSPNVEQQVRGGQTKHHSIYGEGAGI